MDELHRCLFSFPSEPPALTAQRAGGSEGNEKAIPFGELVFVSFLFNLKYQSQFLFCKCLGQDTNDFQRL